MAVANSIKTKEFGNDKQILIAPELAFTVSVLVGNTGVTADSEGRKIIKAGTPVGSSADVLINRQTVLSVGVENLQGVLLHDVDVTDGDTNTALVVEGIIDLLKLDDTTRETLTNAASSLRKITLMNGYKG